LSGAPCPRSVFGAVNFVGASARTGEIVPVIHGAAQARRRAAARPFRGGFRAAVLTDDDEGTIEMSLWALHRPIESNSNGKDALPMEPIAWLALTIFSLAIIAVLINVIEPAVAAMVGVVVMVWAGIMTEVEAFLYVDWNVMAILVGVWVIAGYFGKSGIPELLSAKAMQWSGGHYGPLVIILSLLAGILSIVVDNVVVILMLAPVAIPVVRQLGFPLTPVVLMIGFSANFMGTALLLGDLPPQMLHSVAGAEFLDFIWQDGRPSSFPILMATFALTLGAMYLYGFRRASGASGTGGAPAGAAAPTAGVTLPDPLFAAVVLGGFAATIVAMAFREVLDVKLGFIATTGALLMIAVVEFLGPRLKQKPDFDAIVDELDWRAVFFYIALFALVGGLEKTDILHDLAELLKPIFASSPTLGATLLYWTTIPIVGVVEHDAYILAFLVTIRDMAGQGIDPWPLWWMLVWSGTLGSNFTVAGAPALYVAVKICEREEKRKIPLREFLSWSVPFTLVASAVCYVFGMLIWVL